MRDLGQPGRVHAGALLRGWRESKAIAENLHGRESTPKICVHNIYDRLEVDGRLVLILYALDKGLI